jgi:D-alanyl-D-alanine carboxypeptidase/D-alanyl-D-alanine-endopeptidase (penicillin-binding protein 4)
VGGVDGTTRNRFRGSAAAERVRAKTGTLNGVSCLSGYVGDQSDLVVFSIMVEGLRHHAVNSVRGAQVSAVNAMMRYARGTLGPAPAEEAMPLITRTLTGTRPSCRRSSPRRGPENRRH